MLLNAGNSPSGIEFSARNVDINFASLDTLENIKTYTDKVRAKARDDFGRQIDVMTYGLVVCRETEKDAKAAFQQVLDDGDWGAAGNVIKIALSGASQSFDHAREMSERFIAGWGGYPLVGTPEQVVEGMKQLNDAGMGEHGHDRPGQGTPDVQAGDPAVDGQGRHSALSHVRRPRPTSAPIVQELFGG